MNEPAQQERPALPDPGCGGVAPALRTGAAALPEDGGGITWAPAIASDVAFIFRRKQ